jgi:hypothetical protein
MSYRREGVGSVDHQVLK